MMLEARLKQVKRLQQVTGDTLCG